MLLELKFSIGTLSLSTAALIAAFFGMNLKNFMEESDLGFGGVCVVSFAIAAVVCGYGLGKLRRVQKVSMWGEQGVSAGRGRNWRNVDGDLNRIRDGALPEFARKTRIQSKVMGKMGKGEGGRQPVAVPTAVTPERVKV